MMKEKQAEILLAAVITARATSFIFAKWCLADLDTFNLLAVRFLLAFLLLGVLFSRKRRGVRPAHGGHVRRLRAWKTPPLFSCRCLRRRCTAADPTGRRFWARSCCMSSSA